MVKPPAFSAELLDYIENHKNADPYRLLLRKSPWADIEMETIVRQIQGQKIAKNKYPFLLEFDQYIYPKKESLEQASSEETALYKAQLMKGHSFADLTGGMGIDCYLLGRKFDRSVYVEPNTELYQNTIENYSTIGYTQCIGANETCETFIETNSQIYDWIYLDPSRRIDGNRKTSISNYEPNILDLKTKLLETSTNILVKLSPMQDISECVKELINVNHIWIISVKNEVKELLLHLTTNENNSPNISVVDLSDGEPQEYETNFRYRNSYINSSQIKKYIYQPAAGLVKSELHNHYAQKHKMTKLHPNTQLYTHDEIITEFFGRIFEVTAIISSNKKEIKKHLPKGQANIITKNFPLSPSQLGKKLSMKDGGHDYLIGCTDYEEKKRLIVAKRLK